MSKQVFHNTLGRYDTISFKRSRHAFIIGKSIVTRNISINQVTTEKHFELNHFLCLKKSKYIELSHLSLYFRVRLKTLIRDLFLFVVNAGKGDQKKFVFLALYTKTLVNFRQHLAVFIYECFRRLECVSEMILFCAN